MNWDWVRQTFWAPCFFLVATATALVSIWTPCFLLISTATALVADLDGPLGKATFEIIPPAQGRVWDREDYARPGFIEEPEIDVLYQAPYGTPKGIVLILPGTNRRAADMFKTSEVEVGKMYCAKEASKRCNGLPMARQMRRSILQRGYVAMSTSSSTGEWGAGPLSDLDPARAAKAVQHVMGKTGTQSLPVYVIGVQAGQILSQMLKPLETQMPPRLLRQAELTKKLLPSVHQSIQCLAPQLSALQVVAQDNQRKAIVRGKGEVESIQSAGRELAEKTSEDPLGDCLKVSGWEKGKVDKMSNVVKRGFVSKKLSRAVGVEEKKLLQKDDMELARMCLESAHHVKPVSGALAGDPKREKKDKRKHKKGFEGTLADCLVEIGWPRGKVDAMNTDVQRKMITKKVSVKSNIAMTKLEQYNETQLAALCPLPDKNADKQSSQVQFDTKLMEDRTYPPTIFAHMPRNSKNEVNIAKSMCQLKQKNVRTAEVQAHPKKVTIPLLVTTFGFSEWAATGIIKVWEEKNVLNEKGFLSKNPLEENDIEGDESNDPEWVIALRIIKDEMDKSPGGGGADREQLRSLGTGNSVMDDVVKTVYAESNMIAEHTGTIIDFCEGKDISHVVHDELSLERRFPLNKECKVTYSAMNQVEIWN